MVVFALSCTVIACSSNAEGTEKKTDNSRINREANNTYTSEAKELEEKENIELSDKYFIGFDYCFYDIYNPGRIIECRIRYDKKVEADYIYVENGEESIETQVFDLTDEQFNNIISGIDLDELYYLDPEELDPDEVMDGGCVWLFISVGETPTSISGEMKHISLSGGYNPPTEIKPDRGLQECAEEDVSKADAHSAARTLERS